MVPDASTCSAFAYYTLHTMIQGSTPYRPGPLGICISRCVLDQARAERGVHIRASYVTNSLLGSDMYGIFPRWKQEKDAATMTAPNRKHVYLVPNPVPG